MPWAATFSSTIKIFSRAFTQKPTGEWVPPTINWSTIVGVPCRIFPATEREIKAIWGEALQVDAIVWVDPSVTLPVEVLTSGSGAAVPVQVDGITYMAVRSRDLAHMTKMKAIGLRRYTHG